MEEIIAQILDELRRGRDVGDAELARIVRRAMRAHGGDGAVSKRELLAFCRRVRDAEPDLWASWHVDEELERRLVAVLRKKPRRSASGVATITVITKPWPCSGRCVFCPSDVRMPKSYLHGEPACERAEENFFDPYLQVASRLTTLAQMGHATDKVELIVLGGTWTEYPEAYQIWFVGEMFRALNEGASVADPSLGRGLGRRAWKEERAAGERLREEGCGACGPARGGACEEARAARGLAPDAAPLPTDPAIDDAAARRARYLAAGYPCGDAALEAHFAANQAQVNAGKATYNEAIGSLYGLHSPQAQASAWQRLGWDELERRQRENESVGSRVVGLVMETRPDAVDAASLTRLRRLGATKVQMGVQSTSQQVLDANGRGIKVEIIERAFELLRAFGFKVHAHAMVNLLGSDPAADERDYARLVTAPAFQPDEIKLYPCALIESARLRERYGAGEWRPYTEGELVGVLANDVLATPAFCRISRMIRDFSSNDIVAGNKKPNLRQLVERRLRERPGEAARVAEIRFREVGTGGVDASALSLAELAYETTNTRERFLQWVAPDGRIAGFLRLSLPREAYVRERAAELPVAPGEAMIREVHVYGMATRLGEEGRAAQHLGLGRALVERACEIAREEGYARMNVISAVGTREYYRGLGFADNGLYQQRLL